MPLYEYRCESCGHQFEVIQKFSDAPIDVCPKCKAGPVVKLISSPAIQFKGTGWYITDYARKGKDGGGKDSGKGSTDKDSGTSSGKDESKASTPSSTSSSEPSSTASSTPKTDTSTGKQ